MIKTHMGKSEWSDKVENNEFSEFKDDKYND